MRELIEDSYFSWLCAKVRPDTTPTYLELFRILHSHPFVAVHPSDENRIADALEFREYFLSECGYGGEYLAWAQIEQASVFEVLLAFAERAEFQIEMSAADWFWQFITNLHLEDYRRAGRGDYDHIRAVLDHFVMREYEPNGDGGLFPLRRPKRDQREVEIWYQFCDYVEDNGLMYGLS